MTITIIYIGPGSLTPLAPISMQEMKISAGALLDHPSFQGKRRTMGLTNHQHIEHITQVTHARTFE